jgi:23S rRNA (guanine745-N1)-methyltransferase
MNSLICPLCAAKLYLHPQGLSCVNRHQFDRAREGYFNLLPVHFKGSREPGDAKQQLQARQHFLQAGFFQVLADQLVDLIPAHVTSVLDVGCGEGYFSRAFAARCANAAIYGIDISKSAIKLAAKRADAKHIFAVASSYALPIENASMDVITRIYAPSKDEELARVIKPDGRLIIVTPADDHLIQLRKTIYQDVRPHPKPKAPLGFREIDTKHLSFALQIPAGESTDALLQMTPFAWRLSPEKISELTLLGVDDRADFHINIYQKITT